LKLKLVPIQQARCGIAKALTPVLRADSTTPAPISMASAAWEGRPNHLLPALKKRTPQVRYA
jgi:hypothetical protein